MGNLSSSKRIFSCRSRHTFDQNSIATLRAHEDRYLPFIAVMSTTHRLDHYDFLQETMTLDLNLQDEQGETPLCLACRIGYLNPIYFLLIHGADAFTPCNHGFIPLMHADRRMDPDVKQILYQYTFDDNCCTVELKVLTRAMLINWSLFPVLLDQVSHVKYDEEDLENLSDALVDIKAQFWKLFIKKCGHVVKDMLLYCCTLTNYITAMEKKRHVSTDFLDFLYVFLESDYMQEVAQSCCTSVSVLSSLTNIFWKNKLPLEMLTDIVCCLLSYGVIATSADLNAVYVFYGRCELFNIMLFMDIEEPKENIPCCTLYDHEVIQQSIMPHFIYDIHLNIYGFLQNPRSYLLMDVDVLLDYFALPILKEFFLDDYPSEQIIKKIKRLPSVPSLVELARNTARDYIIERFGTSNSSQFYTILKWLPINNVYKKIISFEKKLY